MCKKWVVFFYNTLLCFFVFLSPVYATPLEIVFWHSMAGDLGAELNQIALRFNKSQQNYLITPVYKGDYIESLTSFAYSSRQSFDYFNCDVTRKARE